jgi:hypothetical protein
VALAALLPVVVAACSDADDADAPTTTSTSPTTTVSTTTTSTPPLTGDPVVVVEQGVSSFPDPFDPAADLGGYGVVLQNPNDEVMATGVRVVTRVLDEAGTELLVDNALLNAILPGQRMAVGRTLIEPIRDKAEA